MKVERWILVGIIILQIAVGLIAGSFKESYHIDEIYTQGLSNSVGKAFITRDDALTWHAPSFYSEYLTVQTDQRFDYRAVYMNQIQDVHPPLYYFMIHTFSSLTPGKFTKWHGIGVNILFLILADILLYFIGRRLYQNTGMTLLLVAVFGACTWTIGSVVFIRMYMMLMFFAVLYCLIHLRILFDKRLNLPHALLLSVGAIGGFMTHYLFGIFAFWMFAGVEQWLLRQRRWKQAAGYLRTLVFSLLTATLLFPNWLKVFFGGSYTDIATYHEGEPATFGLKALFDSYFLLKGIFGDVYLPLLILFIITSVALFQRTIRKNKQSLLVADWRTMYPAISQPDRRGIYWIYVVCAAGSTLTILWIAPSYDAYRYLSPVFPLILILSVPFVFSIMKRLTGGKMNANAAATALACFVLLYSYQAGGIDYLYTERLDDIDSKMSSYHQYNAVCLAANTNNMTIAVPLLSGHVQSCYVPLEDAPQGVREMLEKSGSDSGPLVIYVPGIVHEKKIDESTIEAIAAFCGYKTYRQILSGKESGLQTVVYLLEP